MSVTRTTIKKTPPFTKEHLDSLPTVVRRNDESKGFGVGYCRVLGSGDIVGNIKSYYPGAGYAGVEFVTQGKLWFRIVPTSSLR